MIMSFCRILTKRMMPQTLSSTTNGPLMPPMVLYRIRGWTDIMRGSIVADMAAVASASDEEVWLLEVVVENIFSRVLGTFNVAEVDDLGGLVGWSLRTASHDADWPWH
jgi:hypothetical protein